MASSSSSCGAAAPAAYPSRTFRTRVVCATSADGIAQCAAALCAGHVVAFPTETVYGLGGSALSAHAAHSIFAAKGRPADNPLIVHIASLDMLAPLLPPDFRLSPALHALAQLWPAPLTLLFPAGPGIPRQVTAGHRTVGIRMPAHAVARALIAAAGVPLAAPSANASGRPSPTTAAHVAHDLGGEQGRLPFILDGGAASLGVESTVVDAISVPGEVHVLRPGACTVDDLRTALAAAGVQARLRVYGQADQAAEGAVLRDVQMEQNPTTPGMKYRHYAPDAKVVLLKPTAGAATSLRDLLESLASRSTDAHVGLMLPSDGALSASLRQLCPQDDASSSSATSTLLAPPARLELSAAQHCTLHRFDLGSIARPAEAAARLFDGLRTLDQLDVRAPPCSSDAESSAAAVAPSEGPKHCDVILVEAVEEQGVGLAVMNRLNKAAGEQVEVRT
jgi:L-threonylcarbamoyladenylate synthase